MLLLRGAGGGEETCTRLQLCPSEEVARDPLEEQAALPTPEMQLARRSDDSCTMCHMVFDQVSKGKERELNILIRHKILIVARKWYDRCFSP